MKRRREPWGTWCKTCRTVRLRGSSIVCGGTAIGVLPHPVTVIEVLP